MGGGVDIDGEKAWSTFMEVNPVLNPPSTSCLEGEGCTQHTLRFPPTSDRCLLTDDTAFAIRVPKLRPTGSTFFKLIPRRLWIPLDSKPAHYCSGGVRWCDRTKESPARFISYGLFCFFPSLFICFISLCVVSFVFFFSLIVAVHCVTAALKIQRARRS